MFKIGIDKLLQGNPAGKRTLTDYRNQLSLFMPMMAEMFKSKVIVFEKVPEIFLKILGQVNGIQQLSSVLDPNRAIFRPVLDNTFRLDRRCSRFQSIPHWAKWTIGCSACQATLRVGAVR
jgi:hypothetical protein